MYPLVIVSGPAGSGKDTFAKFLVEYRNGVMIAQADPMKRFVKNVFGFTDEQLWGASDSRNAIDERFKNPQAWSEAYARAFFPEVTTVENLMDKPGEAQLWLSDIGLDLDSSWSLLRNWFNSLRFQYEARGLTPRACLQLLGTEFGRKLNPDLWSNYAISLAGTLMRGGAVYDRSRLHSHRLDEKAPGASFVVITDGRFRNEILNVKKIGGMAFKIVNPAETGVVAGGIAGHASEAELTGIPVEWFDAVITNDKTRGKAELEANAAAIYDWMTP